MKLKRFLILGCIATAMTIISCSGDDGDDGIDGAKGPAGVNGIDGAQGPAGVDGTNGEDGNANVKKIVIDVTSLPTDSSVVEISVPELTAEVLQNNTLIFFLEVSDGSGFLAIPGGTSGSGKQYNVSVLASGKVYLLVSTFDGNAPINWSANTFKNLHITMIETSSLQGKSQEGVLANLKANGVDITNYHEVMQYLGLE
tara:strand:+ start:4302 stop:4898 length:597 start_codon:yes stop_codon:yes gene_type:complete